VNILRQKLNFKIQLRKPETSIKFNIVIHSNHCSKLSMEETYTGVIIEQAAEECF
jgi:hypothetical protein